MPASDRGGGGSSSVGSSSMLSAVEPAVNLNTLVGEKITVNKRVLSVQRRLGEGGFAFVFLVKDISSSGGDSSGVSASTLQHGGAGGGGGGGGGTGEEMVLKVTSIQNREQREIAEKEGILLRRLSHPSIVTAYDVCFRAKEGRISPQHMILMEHCEKGHALDVIQRMMKSESGCEGGSGANNGNSNSNSNQNQHQRFSVKELIVSFGQICNAVSYLHAQKPPIVHRDLKLENFLVTRGGAQYKLCDFGSAVFGHVPLTTSKDRADAEDVIQKTTTQMYRAPEMIDLYMSSWLTQSTDVWALGCCLYSMAFFQNCFEEGSNLAILARNYKIPEKHSYPDGLVELIDRMLTIDSDARADMTEVITCLSAIYSRKALPPRRRMPKPPSPEREPARNSGSSTTAGGGRVPSRATSSKDDGSTTSRRVGTYRTDGQGIQEQVKEKNRQKMKKQAKKLDPNSAAARRRAAMRGGGGEPSSTDPSPSVTSHKSHQRRGATPERSRHHDHVASGGGATSPSHVRRASFGSPSSVSSKTHQSNDGRKEMPTPTRMERRASLDSPSALSRCKKSPNVNGKSKDQAPGGTDGFEASFEESFGTFSNSNNPFVSGENDVSACDSTDPFDFDSISTTGLEGTIGGRPSHSCAIDDDLAAFPTFDESSVKAAPPEYHPSPFTADDGFALSGANFAGGGTHGHRKTASSSSSAKHKPKSKSRALNVDSRGDRHTPVDPAGAAVTISKAANGGASSFQNNDTDIPVSGEFDNVGVLEPDRTFEEV